MFTSFIAIVLAVVVLPCERRRVAMNSLLQRGIEVRLTRDPTRKQDVAALEDWEEPSWVTSLLHRYLPAAYLRTVKLVFVRKSHTQTETDFQEIARLGEVEALIFFGEVEHPEYLKPLIDSDNIHGHLHFERHKVNSESLRQLSRLKSVSRIFFDDATVTAEGLSHLVGMEQLTTLRLKETGCGDDGLAQVARMRNLSCLELSELSITANGLEHLASLTQLKKLVVESIDSAQLAGLSKALSGMKNLRELRLYDANAPLGLEAVADLPNLERLNLSRAAYNDASLVPLSRSKSLRSVELYDTPTTGAGVMHLLRIATLERVHGSRVQVSDESMQQLKAKRPDVQFHFGR